MHSSSFKVFLIVYVCDQEKSTHRFFFFFNKPLQTFPFRTQEWYLLDLGQSSHGRVTVDSIFVDSTIILLNTTAT